VGGWQLEASAAEGASRRGVRHPGMAAGMYVCPRAFPEIDAATSKP